MSKGIEQLKEWAMHNVRLINILPSNKNLPVDVKLIDVLEDEVDKKYYLSEEKTKKLILDHDLSDKLNMYNYNERDKVHSVNKVSPTTTARDYKGPKQIAVREATKKGYALAEPGDAVNYQYPDSKTRRGRVGKGVANTLEASGINQGVVTSDVRIRKLTPLECFRLQGFTDEQFYKAKNAGVSDSQLYKQAGNSVTVNVIDAIARRL